MHRVNNRQGFVLLTAFGVLMALMTILGAFALSVMYNTKIAANHINSIKAYYAAVAGVKYGMYMKADGTLDIASGYDTVNVTYKSEPTKNSYTAVATVNGAKRTVVCEEDKGEFSEYIPKPVINWKGSL